MTEVTALARAYGAGVHAYFSGDAQRAYDDLTQAIEAGTSDPRAWYFRGLAALKLGRLDEAEADFSTASTRETEATGDWAVSRSLERVQGHDRLALERHRVRARVAGYEQRRQAVERRYSQIESRQTEMLRQQRPEGIAPDPVEKFGEEINPSAPAAETMPTPAASEPDAELVPEMTAEEPAADEPAEDGAAEAEAADDSDPAALPAEREPVPAEAGEDVEMADEESAPPAIDTPGGDVIGN
ncbi:MAG: hypothetical protein ACKO1M_12565 [Planctomycetota bacterium]